LRCLQIAKEQGLPHVLIVEDDIQFLNPSLFSSQLNKFFESSMSWDVILFAGNNMGAFDTVNDYAIRVKFCQTATGYLVSNHYYDKLIKNMSDGLQQLMRFPKKHLIFAIDQYWKRLQQEDSWFLITPLTVVQREDYSDIEKKHVNYFTLMTRLIK
jgi:hypothetical protein